MSITASVGIGGANFKADTIVVQTLLNPHAAKIGVAPLVVDGICGALTKGAIQRYQQVVMKVAKPDGLVQPGFQTIASLLAAAPAGGEITATRTVVKLTESDFVKVPKVFDPADGTLQDAYTAFEYEMPDKGSRMVGGKFALAVPNVMKVWPNAKMRIGAVMTPGLLAHEQFHYDVGFVVARTFAHQATIARAASYAALVATYQGLEALHFKKRVGLIQQRYDVDTHHGTNAYYQKIWLDRMAACIANPKANQIGGFWL
ncbi:MAG: hypothetical protein K2Z25_14775 [Beijerinckiaceae bacterium]|nr:hypothetical protein [Beijerinckiaceae bacterium]